MTNETKWLSWRMWLGSGLFWCAFVVLQFSVSISSDGERRWDLLLGFMLPTAIAPALLTPVLFAAVQRIAEAGLPSRRAWSWLAAVVAGGTFLQSSAHALIYGADSGFSSLTFLLNSLPYHFVQFAAIAGVALAIVHHRRAEAQQRELLAAQLRALRSQLQPHFLFNTLHAIGVTARQDGATATRMLALLGDLLRQTLREREGPLVSLAEERQLLQPYLELQQMRFADRLRVQVDLPPEVLVAAVPDLLLQPLVENALQHGIERRPDGGEVRIAARRFGDRLELQVRDDGPGAGEGQRPEGIGLGSTRARLQALFGAAASVHLDTRPDGGTTATVVLPFREHAVTAADHAA